MIGLNLHLMGFSVSMIALQRGYQHGWGPFFAIVDLVVWLLFVASVAASTVGTVLKPRPAQ